MLPIVCFGWLLFRADSMQQALGFLRALCVDPGFRVTPAMMAWGFRILPWLAVLAGIHVAQFKRDDSLVMIRWPLPVRCALYLFFFYSIVIFGANRAHTFIYFQF